MGFRDMKNDDWLIYQLVTYYMKQPTSAAEEAQCYKKIWKPGTSKTLFKGESGGAECYDLGNMYFAHGTTARKGLAILLDGHALPSEHDPQLAPVVLKHKIVCVCMATTARGHG